MKKAAILTTCLVFGALVAWLAVRAQPLKILSPLRQGPFELASLHITGTGKPQPPSGAGSISSYSAHDAGSVAAFIKVPEALRADTKRLHAYLRTGGSPRVPLPVESDFQLKGHVYLRIPTTSCAGLDRMAIEIEADNGDQARWDVADVPGGIDVLEGEPMTERQGLGELELRGEAWIEAAAKPDTLPAVCANLQVKGTRSDREYQLRDFSLVTQFAGDRKWSGSGAKIGTHIWKGDFEIGQASYYPLATETKKVELKGVVVRYTVQHDGSKVAQNEEAFKLVLPVRRGLKRRLEPHRTVRPTIAAFRLNRKSGAKAGPGS